MVRESEKSIVNDEPIIYLATVKAPGSIDIQCRPTGMTMDGYAVVLASMVQATVNMFVTAGVPEKEAIDTILKRLNREARNPKVSATYSATQLQ